METISYVGVLSSLVDSPEFDFCHVISKVMYGGDVDTTS